MSYDNVYSRGNPCLLNICGAPLREEYGLGAQGSALFDLFDGPMPSESEEDVGRATGDGLRHGVGEAWMNRADWLLHPMT